jgi:aminomethyltransferase
MTFGPRVRKSPYFERTLRAGARGFTVYNHTYLPTVYTDPVDEYWKLVSGVTLWDVACQRQVEVSGPDAVELVQRLTPRDVSRCGPGKGWYVVLTDDEGGIINDAVLLWLPNGRLWLSPGDGDVLLWVQAVATSLGLNARVHEPDVSPLQLQGPKAPHVAYALFGQPALDCPYYGVFETELDGIPLVVSRTGWSGELGYELYLQDSAQGEALWDRVMEAGAPYDIAVIAPNTIRSIEGGLLSYVSDIGRADTPFTLGLERLVHLDKPSGFIGQDALRKIAAEGTARKLAGVEIEGAPLSGNEEFWPVLSGETLVGHLTRCAHSPRLGRNIGFVNVPADLAEPGQALSIDSPRGPLPAMTCGWPWVPAEKTLPELG